VGRPSDRMRDIYEARAAQQYAAPSPLPDPRVDRKFARICAFVRDRLPCEAFLDAGCGDGRYLAALDAELPGRVAGIDISERILETARARVTRAGAYSAQATPALAAATSTAPRACPTESAMRASAPTNDSSRTTASGACSAMSAATPSKRVRNRCSRGSSAPVRQHPWAIALRRPPLSWTIPYPQCAVPGSMPTTFTASR